MDRMNNYKNVGMTAETLRKTRFDNAISLRKGKRDEVMSKRRNIMVSEDAGDEEENEIMMVGDICSMVGSLVEDCKSDDIVKKREAVNKIRKVLSATNNPPINETIEAGGISVLVECLRSPDKTVQFQALWSLTNIASGTHEQTVAVVMGGAVPFFVHLLDSPHLEVCDQAIWAVGNIVGDGADMRDHCINNGIIEPLGRLIVANNESLMQNLAWVITNICRSKDPALAPPMIEKIFPFIHRLLNHCDYTIVQDAIWAMSYLTNCGDDVVQMVLESGLVKDIIPCLGHTNVLIQTAALRVIGNIVTGTDAQTQCIVDWDALRYMPVLFNHQKEKIVKEAVWFVSNVCAGSEEQVDSVVQSGLVPLVVSLLDKGDSHVKKEAAWTVSNITISGNNTHAMSLVDANVVPPMCNLLTVRDNQLVSVVLEALINILRKAGDRENEITQTIEECGGLDHIEHLQNHENEEIYSQAYNIISIWFSTDDDVNGNGINYFGPRNDLMDDDE